MDYGHHHEAEDRDETDSRKYGFHTFSRRQQNEQEPMQLWLQESSRSSISSFHDETETSCMHDSRALQSMEPGPWLTAERCGAQLKPINLAPLKGVLESDPMRAKVLRLLIEDGGWVTTADLLKIAKQVRPIVGAVTIGAMLSGLNELVSARLIMSRTSLTSGIEWAEWRLNPDWLEPTRKLLQMLTRHRLRNANATETRPE